MARIEPQVKSDLANIVFPGAPKKYAYRYSIPMLKVLGREPLEVGDWVVVKTKDGLQVVEVASLVSSEKATEKELSMATAWIVDKVSPVLWGKLPAGESSRPPYRETEAEPEEDVDDLLGELI